MMDGFDSLISSFCSKLLDRENEIMIVCLVNLYFALCIARTIMFPSLFCVDVVTNVGKNTGGHIDIDYINDCIYFLVSVPVRI